jgi:uncharacterized protein YcfJ
MKTPRITMVLAAGSALALGACAVAPTAPSVTVLPGSQKSTEQFRADSATCKAQAKALLSNDAQAANNQALTNAAIGTVVGAAAGALLGQGSYNPSAVAGWGAGTGLLIGSTVGGSNSQTTSYSMQQRFDAAYVQCMYQFGHQVPGQYSNQRQAPAVTYSGYPPRNYPPPNSRPQSYPPPNYPPPNSRPPSYPPPNYPPPNYPPPANPDPNYHPLNYPPPN